MLIKNYSDVSFEFKKLENSNFDNKSIQLNNNEYFSGKITIFPFFYFTDNTFLPLGKKNITF